MGDALSVQSVGLRGPDVCVIFAILFISAGRANTNVFYVHPDRTTAAISPPLSIGFREEDTACGVGERVDNCPLP